MRSSLFLLLAVAFASTVFAQTASLSGPKMALSPEGGVLELHAQVTFAETPTVFGWEIELPSGWALVKYGSGMLPAVKPAIGAVEKLEWAYLSVPTSPADFSFTVSYPRDCDELQSIGSRVLLRVGGKAGVIAVEDLKFLPAKANRFKPNSKAPIL